ncbi:putative ribonuclease H-like domain-containing protein [Tanacetum coccineum]
MKLLMIKGKTLKDQENPTGTITEDRKAGIAVMVEMGEGAARGGVWSRGSERSGDGARFWCWPEKSRRKRFPAAVEWWWPESGGGAGGAIQKEDLKTMLSSTVGCSEVGQETKDKFSDFNEFKGEAHVLFTDKECLILSPKFKFVDEDLVILRAPRKNDVYSLDLKNIIPSGGITCLVAKATEDEAVLWHRRLGHVNFKNINKLVKGNLVRGLPSKTFKLDHSCLACRNKGKQHRASCKKIEERTVREPLELLHMDLFGPVSVESVNRKKYCLVVTDDCSKFSWVFFLAYKDETYDMLHDLIVGLEKQAIDIKGKTSGVDMEQSSRIKLMNEFCAMTGNQARILAAASCS